MIILDKVCTIIVTYNIAEDIFKCLDAIKTQVDEVVIVDNGSNSKTLEVLDSIKDSNVKVINNKVNLGIAAALNIGVEYAIEKGYPWVITLDHDSEAEKNMVANMFEIYNSIPESERENVVSIFPTYVEKGYINGNDISKANYTQSKEFVYINEEITSGNLVKTSVFTAVGKFEEKLFIDYVDHDFCLRLIEHGYKLIQCKNAILFHSLGVSKERYILGKRIEYTNHSPLRRYYITRNRFYVWSKYNNVDKEYIDTDKACFRNETIKIILFEANKIQKIRMIIKGARDFRRNTFGSFKA